MASEPHVSEAVDAFAGVVGERMAVVDDEPFLDVGLRGRLELFPFFLARGFDPDRTKARVNDEVDEIGENGKFGGGSARP